jgi:hypothetical protein
MTPAHSEALPVQLVAQHTRAHERVLQVQLVDAAHKRKIGGAHRLGQIIDAASADVEQARLACDAQLVVTVDHGFSLSNPALVSAPSKKSFSRANWPDLRVQRRQVHRLRPGATVKDLRSALEQLAFPFGDLVRMQLELFAQLGHGAIFSQRRQRHARLERRVVGAASAPP